MVPLSRAQTRDRFAAAAIDFLPPFLLLLATHVALAPNLGFWVLVGSSVWFVTRDWLGGGRSLGKRRFNLQVVDDATRGVPSPAQLLLRNAVFGIPGLNILAAFFELVVATMRADGSRLADDYSGTTVVYRTAELDAHIARMETRSIVPISLKLFLERQVSAPSDPPEPDASPPPESSDHSASADSRAETS